MIEILRLTPLKSTRPNPNSPRLCRENRPGGKFRLVGSQAPNDRGALISGTEADQPDQSDMNRPLYDHQLAEVLVDRHEHARFRCSDA